MTKFISRSKVIDIVGDGFKLCDITVSVRLQNGEIVSLSPTEVEEASATFTADKATATLTIYEDEGVTTLRAEGGLIRDRSKNQFFDNGETNLHSHGSLYVNFKSIDGLKSYSASDLTVFWTENAAIGQTDIRKVVSKTQAIIYEGTNNFGCLFATCDKKYKSMFEGSENGLSVVLQSYKRGMLEFSSVLFFLATDKEPYALPERITTYGLKFLGKKAAPASEKRYPEIFEYLGWCSWDAFPLCVSHEGMLEKAEEFKQKNIPVRWGIIDDMWSLLDGENSRALQHDRKLVSFKADPKQFPHGLKAAITDMNEKYGIKIGIWHPFTGYWHGFAPDGETAKEYSRYLTENEDGRLIVKPTAEDMFGYHNAFYTYLKDAGAEFVKVDNQSALEWFYRNMGTVGEIATAVHTGIEGAVGLNFDGAIINCMGCATENIWNRPNSVVNRCSGDFLPEDRKWFVKHILQCTYTCYFYSGLFKGDYDMFWTDDGQAVKNCLLRAMSGGPIYVSDKVGRSVAERLLPCVLADGRILRCNNSAVPTGECLTVDARVSGKSYNVWNCTDNGFVVAAFNLDKNEAPVKGEIDPFTLPGANSDKYLAYDFFSGDAVVMNKGDKNSFDLKNYDEFKFLNFLPVNNGFALIGLTDKYITSATYEQFGKNKYTVKNGGKFAFYAENAPKAVFVDGEKVSPEIKNNYYVVDLGQTDLSHILEFEF